MRLLLALTHAIIIGSLHVLRAGKVNQIKGLLSMYAVAKTGGKRIAYPLAKN